MIDIIVTKRRDDFHTQVKDHPEIWSAGKDYYSAVGNIFITHQEYFGVKIKYDFD